MTDKKIIIFTDGSSRGNPGRGGYGAIILDERTEKVREIGGREEETTNNRMELKAAIHALSTIDSSLEIIIYTDSSYLIKGITIWMNAWKKNGWITKDKKDVSNKDLWMDLDKSMNGKNVSWKYVSGHSGIEGNERCDEIATGFADGDNLDLYSGPLSGYGVDLRSVSPDESIINEKTKNRARSIKKAYSYVSEVGGVIELHDNWKDCEKRVKGTKGARFKKSLDKEDEKKIIDEFKNKK